MDVSDRLNRSLPPRPHEASCCSTEQGHGDYRAIIVSKFPLTDARGTIGGTTQGDDGYVHFFPHLLSSWDF